jgi:hypothetical protein
MDEPVPSTSPVRLLTGAGLLVREDGRIRSAIARAVEVAAQAAATLVRWTGEPPGLVRLSESWLCRNEHLNPSPPEAVDCGRHRINA